MTITAQIPVLNDQHKETYTIVRVDGPKYYFQISTIPQDSTPVRDGRYEDARSQYWMLAANAGDTFGIAERIERKWQRIIEASPIYMTTGKAAPGEWMHDFVGDGPVPTDEFPLDQNDLIVVQPNQARRAFTHELHFGSKSEITFDSRGQSVTVPAGTFEDCFKTLVTIRSKEGALRWQTHTFYAPGVGMVREYQELPNGSLTYRLDLLEFSKGQ